jgi:hypothetical protein
MEINFVGIPPLQWMRVNVSDTRMKLTIFLSYKKNDKSVNGHIEMIGERTSEDLIASFSVPSLHVPPVFLGLFGTIPS